MMGGLIKRVSSYQSAVIGVYRDLQPMEKSRDSPPSAKLQTKQ